MIPDDVNFDADIAREFGAQAADSVPFNPAKCLTLTSPASLGHNRFKKLPRRTIYSASRLFKWTVCARCSFFLLSTYWFVG